MSDIRQTGDAWVLAADGNRYWGTYGAAGLLLHDPAAGILLQHRVSWSDHGGTWGIPGGALLSNESALSGAIRESAEEAAVPADNLEATYSFELDRGGWKYTTVCATVTEPFTPQISDAESNELRWVPIHEVAQFALHPAFASAWVTLQNYVQLKPVLAFENCGRLALPMGAHTSSVCFTHHQNPHEQTGLPALLWGLSSYTPNIVQVFPEMLCEHSSSSGHATHAAPSTDAGQSTAATRFDIYDAALAARAAGHAVLLVTDNESKQQGFVSAGGTTISSAEFTARLNKAPA